MVITCRCLEQFLAINEIPFWHFYSGEIMSVVNQKWREILCNGLECLCGGK